MGEYHVCVLTLRFVPRESQGGKYCRAVIALTLSFSTRSSHCMQRECTHM